MKTLKRDISYRHEYDAITLYHLTDLHLGHAACDEKLLQADIARIAADPLAYWIGGGDYLDAVPRKNDKRSSTDSLAPWCKDANDTILAQLDYVEELLSPIAPKCLGLLEGNHETAQLDHNNRDVFSDFVGRIGRHAGLDGTRAHSLALGYEGFIDLRFHYQPAGNATGHNWKLIVYTHHGFGGGRKMGGPALTMEDAMGRYDADLLLMGHRHMLMAFPHTVVMPYSKMKTRWGVWGGSYLGTYIESDANGRPNVNYAQLKGLPARATGGARIILTPRQRELSVLLSGRVGDAVGARQAAR